MTKVNRKQILSIVQSLTKIVEAERRAIVDRAFDKLQDLTRDKSSLLDEFDVLANEIDNTNTFKELDDAILALHRSAEENAAKLKSLAAGVDRARLRLSKLSEREFSVGAYSRNGDQLMSGGRKTICAKM